MTTETLLAQVKGLEAQLRVLKAQIEQLPKPWQPKSFADLYGMLAGKVSSSEEDIRAAEYRFEWDDTEGR
jgi:hypothetical protein